MDIKNITKKEIREIKDLKLTLKEKEDILERVLNSSMPSPYAPVRSPWMFTHKTLVYIVASFLLLVVSGGSISYASLGAIPGDKLYPIKIKVTEPILDKLAFTRAAKAEREVKKAISRLDEAQRLADEDKLTPETRKELEKQLSKNVEGFDRNLESVEKSSDKKAEILRNSFNQSLDARADSLEKTGNTERDKEGKDEYKNGNKDENKIEKFDTSAQESEASILGHNLRERTKERQQRQERNGEHSGVREGRDENN